MSLGEIIGEGYSALKSFLADTKKKAIFGPQILCELYFLRNLPSMTLQEFFQAGVYLIAWLFILLCGSRIIYDNWLRVEQKKVGGNVPYVS